jgi:hypothetical protein
MKTQLLLSTICIALLAGCANTPVVRDAAYVQRKAENISSFIAGEVLRNNPQPELREKLQKAADELDIITAKDVVTVNDMANIANSIPEVANSKYGFAIRAGQMILFDELEQLAVSNPTLLKAAGVGMSIGIKRALGGT